MRKRVDYKEAEAKVLGAYRPGLHFCDCMTTPSCCTIFVQSVDELTFCITWSGGGNPIEYVLVDREGLRGYIEHWASVKLLYTQVYSWIRVELEKCAKVIGFIHPHMIDGMKVI